MGNLRDLQSPKHSELDDPRHPFMHLSQPGQRLLKVQNLDVGHRRQAQILVEGEPLPIPTPLGRSPTPCMVVTVVTYFIIGYGFVVFGILHLLGLATILAYPFLRSRRASLVAGIIVIGVGIYIARILLPSPWLLWLGVRQLGRYMVDYYPIFPWFGIALLGVFAGLTLYPGGTRSFALPDLSQKTPIRGLTFLGRHSLLIYLIHQPILLAILFVVGIASL